jgi:hypothetical protein
VTIPSRPTAGRGVSNRTWWVIGIVGVLAASGIAVWFGLAGSLGKVHWVNTGFSVTDATEVEVRFDLNRDPARSVVCELQALDVNHARVGTAEVTVGPSESSPSRHLATVRTTSLATTGYVDFCEYAAQ